MEMKVLLVTVFFSTIGLLSVSSDGFAAIYKYTDKDGMIYFADDLQSIPAQYRGAAKIVSGEEKDEPKVQANQNQRNTQAETKQAEATTGTVSEKPLAENKNDDSFGRRAMVSAIVIVSALFAFVILRILDADHKKSVAITRVVIIWGVSIFLLYAHARDVIGVFSSIGSKIESTQQKSEEKGKKAAKALKALDALVERAENPSSADPATAEPEKK